MQTRSWLSRWVLILLLQKINFSEKTIPYLPPRFSSCRSSLFVFLMPFFRWWLGEYKIQAAHLPLVWAHPFLGTWFFGQFAPDRPIYAGFVNMMNGNII
jgi:hypothetical protein